jgi:hypothetical protein
MMAAVIDLLSPDIFPQEKSWKIQEPPAPEDGYIDMEFRLVYRGPLPSSSRSNSRAKDKHAIRKSLHLQLREYWKEHPQLKHMMEPNWLQPESVLSKIAGQFMRGPHRFVPLSREREDSYCSLNILFLRRDIPGKIVSGGGDLDNRLKTLIDALRVPDVTEGLPAVPEPGDDPIFCLLQDDNQITSLNVITDRILTPIEQDEHRDDVLLVIHAHIYRGTNVSQIMGLPGSA